MTILSSLIERGYLGFASNEAKDNSPIYEEWATHIAGSPIFHDFLMLLPEAKQQPNLLFAAIRWVTGRIPEVAELDEILQRHSAAIKQEMMKRSTQTNEAGRCAVLLPLLARLPQPLSLIEVGASAGLCLLPDRYAYDYNNGAHTLAPETNSPDTPVLHCQAAGNVPLPTKLPEVAWRAGVELNPLNLQDEDTSAWLQTLIWPGQEDRLHRLQKATVVAKQQKIQLVKGDLLADLPALLEQIPAGTTSVVFHSAVLYYIRDTSKRDAFVDLMLNSNAHWISNEAPGVLPQLADKVSGPRPSGRFLLCENGTPRAWTGPHGQSVEWIE
ncbi:MULTISPECIES: DUF2332 domain-containing protein [unclassified Pseudovibrio]|uniref:DUF2332 domain-containing protein n=1 Tax=unclassified Pseudovibrio TaxID=2627060 RepID=UPI0007AEBD62|nr:MULTISPECIES: DUF2332 domain-containing protein [unclassified Pseudovibrio]KZL25514.1 hypothetical protein PsWM33_01859 [Pseudovibrio sp. WM33]KZL27614.1 hypothetical protein PsAD37_01289 [Pseudovibrio sp. Ad37]